MKAGIVILAAGESSRMGEPKQLLRYRETTLLRHCIATAHAVPGAPVVVVIGAHADRIRPELEGAEVLIAENSQWHEGMGGSLRVGLGTLLAAYPDLPAVIFLVCDQPLLDGAVLRKLVAAQERSGCQIVASEYGNGRGVPALFTRALFGELLASQGPEGARQILRSYHEQTVGIPFPEGAIDIDTPADYAPFGQPAGSA